VEGSGPGLNNVLYCVSIWLARLRNRTESVGQNSRFSSRGLSPGPTDYEAEVTTARSLCSVWGV
jgi:hypothetical protein